MLVDFFRITWKLATVQEGKWGSSEIEEAIHQTTEIHIDGIATHLLISSQIVHCQIGR